LEDGYFALLSDSNFVRYWASVLTADLGYGLFELAFTWLAITVTHSPAITGLVLFVEFSTYSLTALVGPAIDSSGDKRKFIITIFPVQAAIGVVVAFLIAYHQIGVTAILFIAFIMALLWDFPWLAQSAILPLILKRERLLRANALMQAFGGGSTILLTAMAGIVIAFIGVQGVAVIYAFTFLISAALMRTVKVPKLGDAKLSLSHIMHSLSEGWHFVMSGTRRELKELFFVSGAQGFFSIAPFLLITITSFTYFHGNVREYGILNALLLAGGFLGSIVYGKINPTGSLGRSVLLSTAIEGGLIALSPLVLSSLPLTDMLWFTVGIFDPIFYNGYNSYIQATVENTYVARVKGLAYLLRGVGRGAGNVALGFLILFAGFTFGAEFFGLMLLIIPVALLLTNASIARMGY